MVSRAPASPRTTMSSNSRPARACPWVRISTSPPVVRTEPAARSSEVRRTAAATCSSVNPYSRRVCSETSIEIS
jgi:hypothetical protein